MKNKTFKGSSLRSPNEIFRDSLSDLDRSIQWARYHYHEVLGEKEPSEEMDQLLSYMYILESKISKVQRKQAIDWNSYT